MLSGLRRGAVAVLAASLVMTMASVAAAQLPPGGTFEDDDGNVHEGYIEAIAAEGVTRGCDPPDNTRFCPTDPVTRGQMAAFLTRALGLGPVAEDRFVDDDDSEFEGEIDALAAADIARGCDPPENDRFCPDDHVTRGQMAAFLVRAFGYADRGAGNVFVDDDGSVFEGDIERLAVAGVTVGCNPPLNDRFCPDELVLRDQMASFLGRALQLPPSTPPPRLPGGELTRCESPEGYSIEYPEAWSTNAGDVVPPCGQFHPEPFEVPDGTDERVAAITAYIDPVPFAEVAAGDYERRAVTAVDGQQAVRLEYEADGDGLLPEGTPVTFYAVDLSTVRDEAATLLLDTVGLAPFDYEENRAVLDRMAMTVTLGQEGSGGEPTVVARYRGGGAGFSVEAEMTGSEACLRIPPGGEAVCTAAPAQDQMATVVMEDLEPVLAGVTGARVFAVRADLREGGSSTVLPVPIGDSGVAGFSFTVDRDAIERFTLTDIRGGVLRTVEPGD